MAIIFMDGPDHYGTDMALMRDRTWAEAGGNSGTSLAANAGPGGVGHVVFMGLNAAFRKVLPGVRNELGWGMRIRAFQLPQANDQWRVMQWRDIGNTAIASLIIISTGAIELRRGGVTGTLLWRSEPLIVAQAWQHLEVYLSFDAANKGFRVGIDSVTVFDSDTIYADPTGLLSSCAQVYMSQNGGTDFNWQWRDFYLWDTTGALNNSGMQGDRQVITSFPVSDGPDQDWLPSAGGSGWPLVANNPPVDTSYVYADETDDLSNFGISDIDTDITSISALMVVGRLWKSDAGIGTMQLEVNSGGTVGAGAEQALSTQPGYYSSIFETDPDTGIKWTPAGVNAALAQIRRVE